MASRSSPFDGVAESAMMALRNALPACLTWFLEYRSSPLFGACRPLSLVAAGRYFTGVTRRIARALAEGVSPLDG
jgi:hypothetical protein